MPLRRLAPAKVNLFLHVGPLRGDGYHPVCSLATFADVGDAVSLEPAAQMAFEMVGRFASELAGETNNLVMRARDLLLAERPDSRAFRLTLEKQLPIAAGLGGGSSDAAAALQLVAATIGAGAPDLARVARQLGADALMCLDAVPVLAEGRGDDLSSPPPFPDLPAVLVNPLQPSPTAAVYRAYDAAGVRGTARRPRFPSAFATVGDLADFLGDCRNDLEPPAVSLQPAIGHVLADLRGRPQTLLGRMSGSGATCFAICADDARRDALARSVATEQAGWWVQPCTLSGVPG
ncbi:MAG TPA: 4-(cytidine 5'-diphospho)-2-C-methyl-D-erythritol kinase [Caulobacteraceae bacterium]|nr:4-(cytidine 5'-diphospho)-2-C-methyl-D-erythritol kinase [Caulobacteraceae bacterium]